MKRSLPLALVCALAACAAEPPQSPPAKPAEARATPADNGSGATQPAGSTRMTVYSGDYDALARGDGFGGGAGYALVQRELRYELQAGDNTITIGHLPRAIDVAAVTLQPATPGTSIGAQRFIAPLGDPAGALARALGRRVAVEHTSGGAKQTDNGTLVAIGDGLTVALADGRYKVIREYDSLSLLDTDDLPAAEPLLRWQVQAQKAGTANFRLDYPTGGLAWRAEYVARLAEGAGCKLALDGWAMVANQSGVPFRNVALTLVAGAPNRVRPPLPAPRAAYAREQAAMDSAAAAPETRVSGEYHAYELPGRTVLANGSVERVPLFARAPSVACERAYETAPEIDVWPPPQPLVEPGFNDATGPQPVKVTVTLRNDKAAGLGRPLPAGRVRVFDGADFLGESELAHSAQGAEVRMEVGTAFDLGAERERTDFSFDRDGRNMTEAFAITLRNAKDRDVVVTVAEPLPRWSDWEITASSVPAKKRDAQHVEFAVPVPARGEVRLAYTARYRWAEETAP